MITEDEVGMELVLLLDPDTLEAAGGTYSCAAEHRVQGDHFFLCVYADDDGGKWLPMYSAGSYGRIAISEDGRSGHAKWVNGTFHYHPMQVWDASHSAIVKASNAAGDLSTAALRNTLHEDYFPEAFRRTVK